MNDESPPPPLRLKPRATADSAPPVSPESLAAGAPAGGGAEGELPRLRLKPKFAATSEAPVPPVSTPGAQAPAVSPSPAGTAETEPVETKPRLRPRLEVSTEASPVVVDGAAPTAEPTPPSDTGVSLRPKLRINPEPVATVPEPAALANQPATSVAMSSTANGPDIPSLTPAPSAPPPAFPPPVLKPKLQPAASVTPPSSSPPPSAPSKPEAKPAFRVGLLVVALVALAGVGAGGYLAFDLFTNAGSDEAPAPRSTPIAQQRSEPSAPAVTAAPKQAVAAVPVPSEAAPTAAPRAATSNYGKALEKAREVVTSREENAERQMNAVLAEEELLPLPAVPSREPAPASPAPRAAPSSMNEAPRAVAAIPPSQPFQAWVTEIRISGVRGGSSPRAVINGRLVTKGDLVNEGLGITFEGVDSDQGILYFKEPSGAVVGRKF